MYLHIVHMNLFQLTRISHNAGFSRNQNVRYAGNRCSISHDKSLVRLGLIRAYIKIKFLHFSSNFFSTKLKSKLYVQAFKDCELHNRFLNHYCNLFSPDFLGKKKGFEKAVCTHPKVSEARPPETWPLCRRFYPW